MASNHTESWYSSLLGIAENFRTSNPPNIKLCIHCLQSIFNFKPPPRIEARTHLQIATVMVNHTKNISLAEKHLEKAVSISSLIFTNTSVFCLKLVRYLLHASVNVMSFCFSVDYGAICILYWVPVCWLLQARFPQNHSYSCSGTMKIFLHNSYFFSSPKIATRSD